VNVIFVTQGQFTIFYLDILALLSRRLSLGRTGFYVTNRSNWPQYSKKAEGLNVDVEFLKGWEIVPATDEKPDYDFLRTLEREFGEPFLWNALIADRRVYNGVLTKYKQDYKSRFTHDEMLSLLQKSFESITKFVENIKPDVVIGGFTPVTFGEYIFYLCAKAKGINYINLNPTKILNYVTFSQEIFRQFPHIAKDYKKYLELNERDIFWEKAEDYVENKFDKYEGVIVSSPKFPWQRWLVSVLKWPFVAAKYYLIKDYLDNVARGRHWGYFFKDIYNPVKDKAVLKLIPHWSLEKCKQREYAFYPLHVEPEIALSIFGREYLNQIELIRNIASSIPVTWKLVVKDHPAGVGRRNIRYYRKLLEIPNVVLVNHYIDSKDLLKDAKIIFTVSGFCGFEAILRNKPVITFGRTFYNALPDCMVQNVQSLQELPQAVEKLLEDYQYREKEIICLVAAIIKNSTPLNLYADVLKKKGRITVESDTLIKQKDEFINFLFKWV